jgi:sporulation protein YlmC with PRC-barrel domain
MIDANNIQAAYDATVIDRDGDKVGSVKQVYVDQNDGRPLFASVATGLFGTSESFVPLEGATLTGDELHVNYDKATIKGAPRIDADGDLSDGEQDSIWHHYGLGGTTTDTAGTDTSAGYGADATGTDANVGYDTTGGADVVDTTAGAGHDTSGPNTDDAMTRSEERLNVGTQNVQAGSARLRKHIVTEQQTVTVPVQHEELRSSPSPSPTPTQPPRPTGRHCPRKSTKLPSTRNASS